MRLTSTRLLVATGFLAAAAVTAMAIPGGAYASAPNDTTSVTFTIDAGTLDMYAPVSAALAGPAEPGAAFSDQLGAVTVYDTRGALDASWTATVASSDFTTGGATPAETIPVADTTYWSGPATATTGTGTFTPGQPTADDAVDLSTSPDVMAHAGGSGGDSAAWNPTLTVNVPAAAVAGNYEATMTHSVA